MFFAFSSGKSLRIPAQSPIVQAYHDGQHITRPGTSSSTVFAAEPQKSRIRTSYQPAYSIEVDILVEPQPERDEDGRRETWIVKSQPSRQLARGHVITLHTGSHVIETGRVSKAVTLMRHWVTFRLTGSKDGLQIKVPIPWARLCDLDGYTHTLVYHTLPLLPEPHLAFRNKPDFQNPGSNPYEFDITPSAIRRLRARMAKNPRTKELIESRPGESEEGGEVTTHEADTL
ncbi:uncharacterized protein C8Q71DRAFT_720936 [Rhodofomes roseus]|uniref:Uncharacterized protein n=1 Tax=Rhodofomes roseus TaxID=34475 RepID=A0ABQ8KSR5_9APHY|nr:uncharacterized protein C8Q71DRAFT_727086 [Rhodofomes roseus]XP_047783165.1 uncharacterized protein C8Q71DRAFT_720936 [Rhodofomes roseus]KAH9831283.1 hypothetical protein C8Q71DRAFT_727086 [Rhodofomes roseus]KAH9841866.1 hypothetical protein C8Q71DRAFT_720936 [Rhodofomes roseus]